MESTQRYNDLYRRYLLLFKHVCLLNPGHGSVFVPGIGLIENEWSWCWDFIVTVKIAAGIEEDFYTYAHPLITYIQYKRGKKR